MKITNTQIWKELRRLSQLIEGKDDDRHDQGITGDVEKNTNFRLNIHKLVWIMVGVFLTTIATTIGTSFYLVLKFVALTGKG